MAAPYTHKDELIMTQREQLITMVAAKLQMDGYFIYSPITSSVPLVKYQPALGHTFEMWRQHNNLMLGRCDELLVLKLSGWELSIGVSNEIGWAEELRKPIAYAHMESYNFDPPWLDHVNLVIETGGQIVWNYK